MDQKIEECMICLELLKTKKCTKLTCCNRVFHEECITKWVEQKKDNANACPNCRCTIEEFIDFVETDDKNNVDFVDLVND